MRPDAHLRAAPPAALAPQVLSSTPTRAKALFRAPQRASNASTSAIHGVRNLSALGRDFMINREHSVARFAGVHRKYLDLGTPGKHFPLWLGCLDERRHRTPGRGGCARVVVASDRGC